MPRRNKIDPIAVALAEKALAPARPGRRDLPVTLDDIDLRDLAGLVFDQLNAARARFREAHTERRKAIADERVRHWWRLYNRLIDARE